ncbi:unnamed protein product [Effrenium voratum]|nr:unnamed protein product [Effrenium voratum]
MGKREQVTPLDQSVLDMALHSNKSWQDLGAYETISKAQAADGESLAMHFDLLKSLLLVQPEGQLLLTQVRASILKAVSLEPELNKTSLKNLLWAGSRVDRISTMLYHLRRAKNNTEKCQQLVAKSSSGSLAKVKSLIAMLTSEAGPAEGEVGLAEDEPCPAQGLQEDLQSEAPHTPVPASKQQGQGAEEKEPCSSSSSSRKSPKLKTKKQPEHGKKSPFHYRKEYYKNGNKFGVKKFNNGKCVGQIFAFGHKEIHKVELDALASKVPHDLHLRPGDTAKEEEIMLLAKHKVWKMLKNKHD